MRLLVVTAVPAERDAVLRDLGGDVAGVPEAAVVRTPAGEVTAAVVGVGPVKAAVGTCGLLAALGPFDLVVSAGVAGGLARRAGPAALVVATSARYTDLGSLTDEGFLDLQALGLDALGMDVCSVRACPDGAPLLDRLRRSADVGGGVVGAGVVGGEVLTVTTMTGTDARAAELADAHPGAVAEAMEGWGVSEAALADGVRWAEVRAISNAVGRRDRGGWDLPGALDALSRGFAVLTSAPLRLSSAPAASAAPGRAGAA